MARRDDPRTFTFSFNPTFALTGGGDDAHMARTAPAAFDGMTEARRRELLGLSDVGRAVLATEQGAPTTATAATFAAEPTGRHTRAMLARLTPADFADPKTLWGPITAQEDVDTIAKLDGSMWLTPEIKVNVIAICQSKGFDPPLTWLPKSETEMTPARQQDLLGKSPLGRALLRGAPTTTTTEGKR